MQPASPALAVIGLSVMLLLLGIFISDPAPAIPAMVMILFISGEACMHAWRVRGIVSSLAIEREVRPLILRQGGTTRVSTIAELREESAMGLLIEEMPPKAAEILRGSGKADLDRRKKKGRMEYLIRVLGRGDLRFEGIRITCRDLFFSSMHELRSANFTGPGIMAMPASAYQAGRASTGEGHEVERITSPAGQTVREFRRFRAGDDSRRIDWKLSAKRDATMVREFSGVTTLPSLLFLDLPGDERQRAAFDRLVASMDRLLEEVLRSGARCEICVVSGANLIRVEPVVGDPRSWYRLQGGLQCGEGHVPLIRYHDRSAMISRARELSSHLNTLPSEYSTAGDYLRDLLRLMGHAARMQGTIPYEQQLVSLLGRVPSSELYIFSLMKGDISHIRILVDEAARQRHRIHLRVPGSAMTGREIHTLRHTGIQSVEAI
ncbi:MAG: DUF58 domain-containing protein [Methanomicrobiales archaeon]|nr:DUF58 domain-containing protein [Methanomicrobiales archaeon]